MLGSARSLSVPDPDLRLALVKDIRGLVIPLYSRFYDKYQTIEFSKNPEKYVRWDKAGVEKTVLGLWNVGA